MSRQVKKKTKKQKQRRSKRAEHKEKNQKIRCGQVCDCPSPVCWRSNGDLMGVRQSCRVLSASPHGCCHRAPVLRHRPSILSAALCEENTRCCVWSLEVAARCHGNTDQTAAPTRGGRREGREGRERMTGWGQHRQAVNLRLSDSVYPGPEESEECPGALQGPQGDWATAATEASKDGKQHLRII